MALKTHFVEHLPHPHVSTGDREHRYRANGAITPPKRPSLSHSKSHPGPAPKSKYPKAEKKKERPPFGTNYRVRQRPRAQSPQPTQHRQSLDPVIAHSSIYDFATPPKPSTVAHTQPTARKRPSFSWHEANVATKQRPEVLYTDDELLTRLNTIVENNEDDADRVKTVDELKRKEEERIQKDKEEKDMADWERHHKRQKSGLPAKISRAWSWKGVRDAVGLQ
ncbi:hypothetical protein EJ04DRAFT_2071 [Polyplosphaeria fusca]|uniref:Uncharacterized protein n=1 Tax=Polyplosphaeria fusca TaxID=682080 RepID=A0A9P4RCW4_9PLEO|nr:hypothetical protein EJ04DRAFT_2071 [Polyplosphaeria fusca]